MIKKRKKENRDSNQLHTGNSWKAGEMSPPQSGATTAVYHPYYWGVGCSPEMELTLRKERITYRGAHWGAQRPGAREGQVEMGEQWEADEAQTLQREHGPSDSGVQTCVHTNVSSRRSVKPGEIEWETERWLEGLSQPER